MAGIATANINDADITPFNSPAFCENFRIYEKKTQKLIAGHLLLLLQLWVICVVRSLFFRGWEVKLVMIVLLSRMLPQLVLRLIFYLVIKFQYLMIMILRSLPESLASLHVPLVTSQWDVLSPIAP